MFTSGILSASRGQGAPAAAQAGLGGGGNKRWHRLSQAVCLAGAMLYGTSAPGAENCVRIKKDGIIYYYFAERFDRNSRVRLRALPISRPPAPRLAAADGQGLHATIQEASRHHNLPPALVKAVIRVESNFNPVATSPKGAQGLMQLMPQIADELGVANPYNVRENVWGGTRYLWMMLQRFNNHLPLALAAYNAGPQRVEGRQAVPPIKETQDFVRDVCRQFLRYRSEDPASP